MTVDEAIINTTNKLKEAAAILTNGSSTASTGDASQSKHPEGIDWQVSDDSAVGEDIEISKECSQMTVSREALLKATPRSGQINSHSRI